MNATTRRGREQRLIEGVIGASALFRGVPASRLVPIARHCCAVGARRGDLLVQREERLPGVFAVAYGTIKLALRHRHTGERVVRLVQAGQTFGEPSALLGRAAGYEARAVTDAKAVVIPAAAIFALIDSDPLAARQVVKVLAERSVALMGELESSSLRRASRRVAAFLDGLADPSDALANMCMVELPASKTLIASRLDMSKETFSRLLRALSERGLIRVAGGQITLLDRAALRNETR